MCFEEGNFDVSGFVQEILILTLEQLIRSTEAKLDILGKLI